MNDFTNSVNLYRNDELVGTLAFYTANPEKARHFGMLALRAMFPGEEYPALYARYVGRTGVEESNLVAGYRDHEIQSLVKKAVEWLAAGNEGSDNYEIARGIGLSSNLLLSVMAVATHQGLVVTDRSDPTYHYVTKASMTAV